MNIGDKYDVIVVGAGHAGCEAAAAAATLGVRTLLITLDMSKFAQMSCNPAIGGIAKGQIVREIDALGGFTGVITDRSSIQFRMLNKSKGPAMWSPRAQCDRILFSLEWRQQLETLPTLEFWQDTVTGFMFEGDRVCGVKTKWGMQFYANSVILTTGTFENGLMHVGNKHLEGGRMADPSSKGISDQLKEREFEVDRMKTGTPARLDGRSINFDVLEEQKGDEDFIENKFSFLEHTVKIKERRSCYITYTSNDVHEILKSGFNDSPLFSGTIQGRGPRYCPSIEDKVVTFADKDQHLLFLEPEGVDNIEYYLNGFSSSLPYDVQYKALRKIRGLENVKIFRPGYAIEYDYYPPTQLKHTLETKNIENLYFAGQINGTTGYEEAGAQGLVAGVNAARKIQSKEEFVLRRDQAYIGVLIDDLVTKGVDEPYRMFTSRAEYRILLRQDNADERLTEMGYSIGLASRERYEKFKEKIKIKKELKKFLFETSIKPEFINSYLESSGTSPLKHKVKLKELVLRPQVKLLELMDIDKRLKGLRKAFNSRLNEIIQAVEIEIKYDGYIERENLLAEKIRRLEKIKLREDIDYDQFKSITIEGRQKLNKTKPRTIGQASRISGVSPSDINVLLVYLGR